LDVEIRSNVGYDDVDRDSIWSECIDENGDVETTNKLLHELLPRCSGPLVSGDDFFSSERCKYKFAAVAVTTAMKA
jgi:hypothetical protein